MDLFEKLKEEKIIAILRGMERAVATRKAEALINGGIQIIEVPMNGEKAEVLIAEWQERYQRLVSEGRYEELTKHAERFVNQVKDVHQNPEVRS